MGIKHTVVAAGVNDGTKQVSVNAWNAYHAIDAELDLPNITTPATPATDHLSIFNKQLANRNMLTQMGSSGLETSFQPNLGGNKVALWMPPGNTTTVPGVWGMNALTAVGTATARTIATTNILTRMTRLGYVSAATAGSLASVREAQSKYTTGAGAGVGGFFMRVRFGISDAATVAGARMFIGLKAATAAATNVEPNTTVNTVGVGQISTSTNLQLIYAGTAAGGTIDLGVNFPCSSTNAYELTLYAPPDSSLNYQVTRLGTGFTAVGTLSAGTTIPTSATLLGFHAWRCNNATALAVGLDLCGVYIETDN